MTPLRKLIQQGSIDFRYRLVTIAISMVYGIVISRALGSEGRGVFVLTTLIIQNLFMNIASFGLNVSLQVAAGKRPNRLGEFHGDAILLSLLLGGLGAIGLFILRFFHVADTLTPILFFVVCLGFPLGLYQALWAGLMNGSGNVVRRARIDLIQSTVLLVSLALCLLIVGEKPFPAVVSFYAAQLLVVAIMYQTLSNVGKPPKFRLSITRWKKLFQYSYKVYASEVAAQLRGQLDVILLGLVSTPEILGIYHQAVSLAKRGLLPAQSLCTASWQPVTAASRKAARELTLSVFTRILLIAAIVSGIGYVCAPLIPLIYGSDFESAIPIFRVLVFAISIGSAGQIFGVFFLGNMRRPDLMIRLNWLTLMSQVALIIAFAFFLSWPTAILWGTALVYLAMPPVFWMVFRKQPLT